MRSTTNTPSIDLTIDQFLAIKSESRLVFAIFASLTPTEDTALVPISKTLTVLFNTLGLSTLTPLPNFLQVDPELEAHAHNPLGILLFLKSFGIPRQGLYDGLLLLSCLLHIATPLTTAVLTTEDLQVKALTVHFQAVGFAAVAARGR
jgi:hypothetical protein